MDLGLFAIIVGANIGATELIGKQKPLWNKKKISTLVGAATIGICFGWSLIGRASIYQGILWGVFAILMAQVAYDKIVSTWFETPTPPTATK